MMFSKAMMHMIHTCTKMMDLYDTTIESHFSPFRRYGDDDKKVDARVFTLVYITV